MCVCACVCVHVCCPSLCFALCMMLTLSSVSFSCCFLSLSLSLSLPLPRHKNPTSFWGLAATLMCHHAMRVVAATGTPYNNNIRYNTRRLARIHTQLFLPPTPHPTTSTLTLTPPLPPNSDLAHIFSFVYAGSQLADRSWWNDLVEGSDSTSTKSAVARVFKYDDGTPSALCRRDKSVLQV